MRTVGVVTGGRADYGIYVPLLRAIVSDPSLELSLLVTGSDRSSGIRGLCDREAYDT